MNAALFAIAVFFLGMGIAALIHPAWILSLFKTSVTTPEGRNEVRAVYGGYGLAMSIMLAFSIYHPELRAGIILCVAFAMAGMASGRLISFVTDRKAGALPVLFFIVEILIAALLLTS